MMQQNLHGDWGTTSWMAAPLFHFSSKNKTWTEVTLAEFCKDWPAAENSKTKDTHQLCFVWISFTRCALSEMCYDSYEILGWIIVVIMMGNIWGYSWDIWKMIRDSLLRTVLHSVLTLEKSEKSVFHSEDLRVGKVAFWFTSLSIHDVVKNLQSFINGS